MRPSSVDPHRRVRAAARMRGVVTLEFIIALPAILLFLMAVFQVTHGHAARQLVGQAAQRAARAASLSTTEGHPAKARERNVHLAAALTLTPIAPPIATPPPDSPSGALATRLGKLGASPADRRLIERWSLADAFDSDLDAPTRGVAKFNQALRATRIVSIEPAPPSGGRTRVVIEHAFYCGLPFASFAFCDAYGELDPLWHDRRQLGGLSPRGRYLILRGEASFITPPQPGAAI